MTALSYSQNGAKKNLCPYAVGDVYVTMSAVNPATRWGDTTWELVAAGTFLVAGAASGTYKVGNTGGEAAHRLSVSEMPSHNHNPSADMLIVGDLGNRAFAQGEYGYAPSGTATPATAATTGTSSCRRAATRGGTPLFLATTGLTAVPSTRAEASPTTTCRTPYAPRCGGAPRDLCGAMPL